MSVLTRNPFLHSTPLVAGHRGGAGDPVSRVELTRGVNWAEKLGHPPDHYEYRAEWQNRLSTFDLMTRKGMTSLETDFLPSKDGTPVVVHDSELEGRPIWDFTDEELAARGIPTQNEAMDLLERNGVPGAGGVIFKEGKGMLSGEHGTDVGKDGVHPISRRLMRGMVAEIERRVGPEHGWSWAQLPIIGFNHAQIAYAKELNANVEIGLTYGRESFDLSARDFAQVRERPDFLSFVAQRMVEDSRRAGAYGVNIDTRLGDPRLVRRLHDNGLGVYTWASFGIPEPRAELTRMGVDGLITDHALEAQAELAARKS